jgi:hypothetical protein
MLFENPARTLILLVKINVAGIQSFRSGRYVLFSRVYAMSRVMPHEVGERAIGAGFITFLMA